MPSFVAGILVALAVLALLVQLLLPPYLAGRVEDRLDERGGTAEVELSAFPALSLLAGRGGSFVARGSGLRFEVGERQDDAFRRLDGFERVDVRLEDLDAGPLRIGRFELTRTGRDTDYRLEVRAETSPGELAQLGGTAAGPLGGLAGSVAGRIIAGGGASMIPLELHATLGSEDGRPAVIEADGSVAGLPAGPFARGVLALVLDRL